MLTIGEVRDEAERIAFLEEIIEDPIRFERREAPLESVGFDVSDVAALEVWALDRLGVTREFLDEPSSAAALDSKWEAFGVFRQISRNRVALAVYRPVAFA